EPDSTINILDLTSPIFVVEEDGVVIIDGGTIVISIGDEESFSDFIDLFEDDIYDLTIIDGSYEGEFDGINLDISKEASECADIDSSLDYRDNESVHAIFKLNRAKCGIKWWVILLICEGIFFVVLVFI